MIHRSQHLLFRTCLVIFAASLDLGSPDGVRGKCWLITLQVWRRYKLFGKSAEALSQLAEYLAGAPLSAPCKSLVVRREPACIVPVASHVVQGSAVWQQHSNTIGFPFGNWNVYFTSSTAGNLIAVEVSATALSALMYVGDVYLDHTCYQAL